MKLSAATAGLTDEQVASASLLPDGPLAMWSPTLLEMPMA